MDQRRPRPRTLRRPDPAELGVGPAASRRGHAFEQRREAGSHGLPLVGLDAADDPTGIWTAEAPGLDPVMRRCRHADELTDALAHLIDDPSDRLARGHETRDVICERHTGTGWSGQLADIYRTADRTADGRGDRPPPSSVPRLADELDLRVAALMTAVNGVSALYHFGHRLPGRVLVPTLLRVWPSDRRAIAREVAWGSVVRVLDAVGLRSRAASARDRWRNRSG